MPWRVLERGDSARGCGAKVHVRRKASGRPVAVLGGVEAGGEWIAEGEKRGVFDALGRVLCTAACPLCRFEVSELRGLVT